jgi:hypothetical protein
VRDNNTDAADYAGQGDGQIHGQGKHDEGSKVGRLFKTVN